ncbi:MAG: hypothetical protein IJ523_01590 [Succinivibrionaceae bacterium]|nr:hypothetical protein [Succinivibrionaceae bacterium]
MIVGIIAVFLLFMALCSYFVIRYVPDDCVLVVRRRDHVVIMRPGLDFLIPFVDKSLGLVRVRERNIKLCEFVVDDLSFLLRGTVGVVEEDKVTPEVHEDLEELVGTLACMLKQRLETEDQDEPDWKEILPCLESAVNEAFRSRNAMVSDLVVSELDPDELRNRSNS